MVRIQNLLSAEDLIQYRIVKPVRRKLRNTAAQYVSNEKIIELSELGIKFTDEIIKEMEYNKGFVNHIKLT